MAVDDWLLQVLRCPECGEKVVASERSGVTCTRCGREYPERDGILVMLPEDGSAGSEP